MAGENTATNYSNKLDQARLERPGNFNIPQDRKVNNNMLGSGYGDRLSEARERDEKKEIGNDNKAKGAKALTNTAISIAKNANPMGAASLLKQVNLMADMPFVIAIGAALLKDLLDFVAAPTVVLSILFSMLCSIFIFMMLMLVSANGKRSMASSMIKKGLLLIGGGIADSIPGVDFFPIESITVVIIYYLTLLERKNVPQSGASDNYEQDEEAIAA